MPTSPSAAPTAPLMQAEPWKLLLAAFSAGAAATLVLAGLALPLGWLLARTLHPVT